MSWLWLAVKKTTGTRASVAPNKMIAFLEIDIPITRVSIIQLAKFVGSSLQVDVIKWHLMNDEASQITTMQSNYLSSLREIPQAHSFLRALDCADGFGNCRRNILSIMYTPFKTEKSQSYREEEMPVYKSDIMKN